MEIRRFFVNSSDIVSGEITIRGDEFSHLTRVLRYKIGYKAIVCSGDGIEHHCVITEIGKDFAKLKIEESVPVDKKNIELTLYAGLLKNNKLDFVVQKGVELGVDRIVPFTSVNCAENKFSAERANKIALEAAKQCGSAYLSEVGTLIDFQELTAEITNYDSAFVAYEEEKQHRIADIRPSGAKIALIIGPEGGFKFDEVLALEELGVKPITLGRRILRAETASIVGVALLLNTMGELDYS